MLTDYDSLKIINKTIREISKYFEWWRFTGLIIFQSKFKFDLIKNFLAQKFTFKNLFLNCV